MGPGADSEPVGRGAWHSAFLPAPRGQRRGCGALAECRLRAPAPIGEGGGAPCSVFPAEDQGRLGSANLVPDKLPCTCSLEPVQHGARPLQTSRFVVRNVELLKPTYRFLFIMNFFTSLQQQAQAQKRSSLFEERQQNASGNKTCHWGQPRKVGMEGVSCAT